MSERRDNYNNLRIALRILRAWNHGTAGFHGAAVSTVHKWIDAGMEGPIPYPDSPFFEEWAEQNGIKRRGDYAFIKDEGEFGDALRMETGGERRKI